MSLYAGTDVKLSLDEEVDTPGGKQRISSVNLEMLAPQLKRKQIAQKAAALSARPRTLAKPSQVAARADVSRPALVPPPMPPAPTSEPFIETVYSRRPVMFEYAPSRPNDYADIDARKKSGDLRSDDEDDESYAPSSGPVPKKAAIAPPPELAGSGDRYSPPPLSDGLSWADNHFVASKAPPPPSTPTEYVVKMSNEEKAKSNSMSAEEAYQARLRMSQGVAFQPQAAAPAPPPPRPVELPVTKSRVILLTNVVGPNEVDPDLESEISEECSNFGKVRKCIVVKCPPKTVPDDEAVRIFVEFNMEVSANKAIAKMNGRFFGGRTVRARLYNMDKYELELFLPD
eukprot:m.212712 g.212712  ORF g.212712 m.212712 type:complete len:343 (-) comp21237_c0_seq1:360-1388(-)